jgi:hypothetical protein
MDNNGTSGITLANEPGNQLGGFDWRWQWPGERGYAFYGQWVGEDENGFLPSAYIVQAGLEARWALAGGLLRGFVEWNDLIAGHANGDNRPHGLTYRSGVYQQGYRHDGMLLGHPAGGDVTLASAGLVLQASALRLALVASHGRALPTSQRFAAGTLSGFNGSAQVDLDPRQQLGAGLGWWRDTADTQQALQLWWRVRF